MSASDRPKAWRVDAHDVARLAAFVAALAMTLLLVVFLSDAWSDDAAFAHRDFDALWNAGVRAWAGESPYSRSTQPFVHPPLAIPLVAIFALVPERTAFVVVGVSSVVAFAAALVVLARACRASDRQRVTLLAVGASAPSLFFALFLGQLSGLYVLCFAGCFAALSLGAEVVAGVCAGLLLIKPPLALALVLAVVASRSRRALGAMAVTAGLLFVLSLPFGFDAWSSWMSALGWWRATLEDAPGTWWRQWTLYAFARSSAAELGLTAGAARLATLAIALPLGATAMWFAARALQREPALRMRAGALLALVTVALNGYLFYYDALLLVVPAAVAFLHHETYAPGSRFALAMVVTLSWLLQLVTPLIGQGEVPLPGIAATMWLLVEVIDLARALRVAPPARR